MMRTVRRVGRWLARDPGQDRQIAALRAENTTLRGENAELLAEIATLCKSAEPASTMELLEPPPVVPELIAMADRLVDLTGRGQPHDLAAVLRWLSGRSTRLLAACEVEPIDDDGPVDLSRHEVVADRPTPDESLADRIAETVRPGYAWRGRIVRYQQVIVYSPTDASR